ncbi:MAG: peptidase M20 [Sphingomonas sp. 28-66-16]|nr:MAG: peptidase M20 [Sphingomonas sp. 28-66-16]
MSRPFLLAGAICCLAALPVSAKTLTDPRAIAAAAPFRLAQASLDQGHDHFIDEIVELTQIPSPPFKEARRAAAFAAKFRSLGLRDVTIDPEGNVLGIRPGTDPKAPFIVFSAHLDTVFPEGTDVTVRRDGTTLRAPGIGDDTRSLAVLLAYVRALDAAKISTRHPILFVGTVGEEGQGDLRGVRYLFTKGSYKDRIAAFYSMDGANPARVTLGGVGSKRYRVTFKGPGGHSYGAFGIVNPMAAMAATVSGLYAIPVPTNPKTTYAASVTGGGTSVNSIPAEIFLEVDMRSEQAAALATLDHAFVAVVDRAVAAENAARSTRVGKISAELKLIGERPAGSTAANSTIVTTTAAAARTMGYTPDYESSSTDANIAMSLGIPAITIGSGGTAARAHSLDEHIDVAKPESLRGMSVGLLSLLAMAGMESGKR